MKLIVNELKTELFQTITPAKNTQVEAVRINLYKHNFPAGNFIIELHDSVGELIATSATSLTASDISSSNFFHGFVRFYVNAQLMAGIEYRVVLKSSGYVFSESAYIGWCNSFDLSSYNPDYELSSSFQSPLSLEFWERVKK